MNFFIGLGLFSDKYWSENCGSVEKKWWDECLLNSALILLILRAMLWIIMYGWKEGWIVINAIILVSSKWKIKSHLSVHLKSRSSLRVLITNLQSKRWFSQQKQKRKIKIEECIRNIPKWVFIIFEKNSDSDDTIRWFGRVIQEV